MNETGYSGTLPHLKTPCRVVLAVTAILISGCTLFSPVENTTRVAVIDKVSSEVPRRHTHPATLLISPPSTTPVYDTIRMAYRAEPHQVGYFSRNEWGATPAQMFLPLLVRTLENTGYFDAVVTPPYFGPYNYALRTEIIEFVQDFTSTPATLHFSLRVQLLEGNSSRIIASTTFTLREPMLQESPIAGVVAANDAAAKALQQAALFVLDQMP